jgi:peptidoglycan/LPS O-acetylase OafA/YrhL
MLHHTQETLFGSAGLWPSRTLFDLANAGPRGVDIFFGISGFLICSRLLVEWRKTGQIDLTDFYIRRTFRIMPPLFVYIGVIIVLTAVGCLDVGWWSILSALTFWRNYLPGRLDIHGFPVAHTWSLGVEEHFYLFWPVTLILLATRRRAAWAALGIALVVAVWRTISLRIYPLSWMFWRTDLRIDGLLWGAWIALVVDDPVWRARLTRWITPGVWLALAGVFMIVVMIPFQLPMLSQFWIAILVPFLLIGTVLWPESPAGRILEWRPLRWIGRLSYSLYLWQQLFLIRPEDRQALGLLQTFPLNWLAAFACALASHHLIERPFIRLGRNVAAHHANRRIKATAALHQK